MVARFLDVTKWPAALVLLVAGLLAAALAFLSFNLFNFAMANAAFLARYGWVAVMEGALWQLAGLTVNGVLALLCYLGFKICEVELTQRYRLWTINRRSKDTDR